MRHALTIALFAALFACGEDDMAAHTFILDNVEFEEVRPAFVVTEGGALSIATGYVPTYDTALIDTFDYLTGGIFVAPGYYALGAYVLFSGATAGTVVTAMIQRQIQKASWTDYIPFHATANAAGQGTVNPYLLVPADINLNYRLIIYHNEGSNITVTSPAFSAHKID